MDPFTDPTLSLRAKGVYSVIVNFGENARVSADTIASLSRDGLESTRAAIRELKDRGYLRMERTRGKGGLLGAPRYVRTKPRALSRSEKTLIAEASNRHGTLGWTYAVSAADRRHVKIGRAVDLDRRLNSHNTSSPVPLTIIWAQEGGAGLETHLHHHFADRWIRGEWFDFTGTDAVQVITVAASQFGGAS
ncbi:GIY-YIG nuclease family protein [Kitasatospora sp. NPDC059408]|uniref:GIY-YIG nuclease family protein n=1 Tax=Kitasatospora sp. NPDC059408 TaxID=3346823 RepID=UPI0036834299